MTGNGNCHNGTPERVIARLLLGESIPMQRLRSLIARLAASEAPVLIEGPTGSGKELVAEALHACSARSGAFVPFNVTALADGTFESSLFGHVRGAFTGAVHDVPGYLAEADRGTAFFDEISSLPLSTQAKLLRAIETRSFRPVGARCDRKSNFRLVTASNEDLAQLVAEGRFRADLFHRLRALLIRVPPLADHLEDVPLLARHFARRTVTAEALQFSDEAIGRLMQHVWSGNVRELRNVVDFAVTLTDGSTVGVAEVSTALDIPDSVAPPDDRAWMRHQVVSVLEDCNGDIARVSERLGLHPSNVYRLLRRLGVNPPKRRRLPPEPHAGAATGAETSG
jgi:DNA-binding NtrC family response regulator